MADNTSVRIVFTASNSLIGRVIRWATNGRVSHVFIQYPDPLWGGEWAAEATVGGVRMVPAEKARHSIVAEYECLFDSAKALQSIRSHVGDRYDYAGLLYFGWAILMWRIFRKKVRRPFRSASEEFCSEFAALFLSAAETLKLVPSLEGLLPNPEQNDPERILDVVDGCPGSFGKASK